MTAQPTSLFPGSSPPVFVGKPPQQWRLVADLHVLGIPKPLPPIRAAGFQGKGGKWQTRAYRKGTAEGWKGDIALAAKPFLPGEPYEGPIRLSCMFYLKRPKRLMRKKDPEGPIRCRSKPDLTNLLKGLEDILTRIGMWVDDAHVSDYGKIGKRYHAKGGRSGARIKIEVMG